MRKYYQLILDHPNEDKIGIVTVSDSPPHNRAEKNSPATCHHRNLETDETWEDRRVGMGYVDYEDEDEYEENAWDDVERKLSELDQEFIDEADLDLDDTASENDRDEIEA